MNKENILYSIIGLLLGCIVGFIFANSVNQKGAAPRPSPGAGARQNSNLPPDHPQIPSNEVADQGGGGGGAQPEVTAQIKKARDEPNNFDAQMKAADLFYQIHRFDEAIEFLLRANQIKPDDYGAIVKLGNANFEAGNYETAERWYAAALIRNADDVNVRTDLGLTFFLRNPPDLERAIKEYRGSLERDPRHEQTLQNLAVALIRAGNAKEAEATIAKLEEINSANEVLPKLRSDLENLKKQSTQQATNPSSSSGAPPPGRRGRR